MEQITRNFEEDIKNNSLCSEIIFHKYFLNIPSFFFTTFLNDPNEEYFFKKSIAEELEIDMGNINIVGSGQLGQSIAPTKELKKFDGDNKDLRKRSDLDIAIVNEDIYDSINHDLQNFTSFYKNKELWRTNKYYTTPPSKYFLCNSFFEYFARGWLRVDFLPTGFSNITLEKVDKIREEFYSKYKIKLSFAFYQRWNDLIRYQTTAINDLRELKV